VQITPFKIVKPDGFDHCHLDGAELPYTLTGVAQLVEEFIAAVSARRAS
jgi:hypothetical protein